MSLAKGVARGWNASRRTSGESRDDSVKETQREDRMVEEGVGGERSSKRPTEKQRRREWRQEVGDKKREKRRKEREEKRGRDAEETAVAKMR